MFKTVSQWLASRPSQKDQLERGADELAGLVTALMAEAATADGNVSEKEMQLISDVIARQFVLGHSQAEELLKSALKEAEDRVQLHGLVRQLRDHSDYEERIGIMEMVWMVVLADGRLDHIEAQMMRRLAGLLFVSDVDSGLAAKTAKKRLDLEV